MRVEILPLEPKTFFPCSGQIPFVKVVFSILFRVKKCQKFPGSHRSLVNVKIKRFLFCKLLAPGVGLHETRIGIVFTPGHLRTGDQCQYPAKGG